MEIDFLYDSGNRAARATELTFAVPLHRHKTLLDHRTKNF